MTLIMNGKTIDPKAIDHTEDQIISDNIEDTMELLGRYIDGLSAAYEGLCELLSDAGMDTKNAIFTTTDSYGRVLTISGLNALKGANSILFTDTDKPTAESIYKAMLRFHDGEGSEIEDSNEFYYGMAEAIVRTLNKQ